MNPEAVDLEAELEAVNLFSFIGGRMEVQEDSLDLVYRRTFRGPIVDIGDTGAGIRIVLESIAMVSSISSTEHEDGAPPLTWELKHGELGVSPLEGGRLLFVQPETCNTITLYPRVDDPSEAEDPQM